MSTPRRPAPQSEDPSAPRAEIREMELEDLPEVFALGERLFTADFSPALYRTWDEDQLVNDFATDRELCLVAELERRIVGFAIGTVIEKRRTAWSYGWLTWLGVDPNAGRAGIGRRLVRRLTERFIELGARMILVDTDANNEAALRLFRRQGFDTETEHVYLWKNVSAQAARQREKDKARPTRHAAPPSVSGGQSLPERSQDEENDEPTP